MFLCLVRDSLSASVPGVLEAVARACSPRVEPHGDDVVVCDAGGLSRTIGPPLVVADEMRRMAWDRGMGVRVAVAGSKTAAWLLAHVRPGITVVPSGEEAAMLSRLPLTALTLLEGRAERRTQNAERERLNAERSTLNTCLHWGLATLGDLARLPRADLLSRLGPIGVRWHQAACGEDQTPLAPRGEAPKFFERVELEWPVEGLEPLSFILARACETLAATLERADRGAVTVTTRLRLVTRETHARTLTLPAPMRDARVLRTLIVLDLEAHPPGAGIDAVEVELGVTPGRIVQGSLVAHDVPAVEEVATLMARLSALMGDTRVGVPALVDTHDPRMIGVSDDLSIRLSARRTFAPSTQHPALSTQHPAPSTEHPAPSSMMRRFRPPIAARVVMDRGSPVRVMPAIRGLAGGAIVERAGPWRSSGHWWTTDRSAWDRDEWDVALEAGVLYRLARDRTTGAWEVEGVVD